MYHLSVVVGTALGQFGTEFEQLVGKLFQVDEDPGECRCCCLWLPVLDVSPVIREITKELRKLLTF